MKKTVFITAILILAVNVAVAQRKGSGQVKWLNLELKGGYGGSMLLNSDVSSDENVSTSVFSPAYEFGARLGITFGDYIGVGVELLSSSFGQEYEITIPNQPVYNKDLRFKSRDIVFALRYTSLYGIYAELGPKFTTIKDVTVSNSVENSFFKDEKDNNYTNHFAPKFTSIMAGFGFAIYNGDRLRVNIGLRASYALSDIVEDDNFNILKDGVYTPKSISEASTNPLSVELTLGVNYVFAFWGNASCGRGRLVFFQ